MATPELSAGRERAERPGDRDAAEDQHPFHRRAEDRCGSGLGAAGTRTTPPPSSPPSPTAIQA